MAAGDEAELVHMVATAASYDCGPIALRSPRGEGVGVDMPEFGKPLKIGKGRILKEGNDVALLSYGTRLGECLKASELLEEKGVSVTVADARFAKPLDKDLVTQLAKHHKTLLTVEEGSMGGFGAYVLHHLSETGLLDNGLKIRTLHLPDMYQDHDSPDKQYEAAGLTAKKIANKALLTI